MAGYFCDVEELAPLVPFIPELEPPGWFGPAVVVESTPEPVPMAVDEPDVLAPDAPGVGV